MEIQPFKLCISTPKGASASDTVYSIVETAKANGLNTFAYLEQLLILMVDWDHTPEFLDEMMPWSDFMQETYGK